MHCRGHTELVGIIWRKLQIFPSFKFVLNNQIWKKITIRIIWICQCIYMEVCALHLNLVHTREINPLHAFSSNFSIQSFKHEERMTLIHFKGQRSSLIGQIWKYVLHTLTLCTQEKLICYMHPHQTLVYYSHLNMKSGWPLFIFMVKGEDPYWMNLKVCTSHLNLCTQEKLICYMHPH